MKSQLGIAIDGEFLDLLPDTKLEMELANPFLQFNDELTGDFSMPFEVRATPKNMRLLRFAGLIQTRIDTAGIDCAVYDNNNQHSVGKIKIENPGHNLLSANRAKISLYYLTGSAGFFQDIKDVNLRSADFGGARSFAWDNYAMTGAGFWSHIHQVLNGPVGAYDYAFFPVINKQWTGFSWTDVESLLMNAISYGIGPGANPFFSKASTDNKELNPIVPFPYLVYVLRRAAAKVGWSIEGAILDDPDFKKIVMVNFQSIDWGYMTPTYYAGWILSAGSSNPGVHPAAVSFDLADHVPDISISDFLISLKNRFGWWYEFDNRNKVIRIKDLQGVVGTSTKDFTAVSTPLIEKKVAQRPTIYSLKNEFIGDYANGQPSLANVYYQGPLNLKSDLPAPTADIYAHTYLIREENNYYICRPVDGSADVYSWQFYAYNVYDVVPDNATDEITTKATTLGVENYFNPDMVPSLDENDLIPRMDLPGNWGPLSSTDSSWGVHLIFNHGVRLNRVGIKYPYASSHIYDSNGTQVANWSLAFKCQTFEGLEVGLYEKKWKKVLDSLSEPESFDFSLYLSLADYLQLSFGDTITVAGVKMYLTKIKPSIAYSGVLPVEGLRTI